MLGQRSNQLNYVPTRQINKMRNRQLLCGFARFAYRAWNCLCCPKERDSCPNRPQTATKFRLLPAPVPCENPLAQTAPGDPDCSQPGQERQQDLSRDSAQKYPNSFSQNTKDHLHFPGTLCGQAQIPATKPRRERLQHGFQRNSSLSSARLSALELDPAFVEAIKHLDAECAVLHALRFE